MKPTDRLQEERPALQPIPPAWRGDISAARPQSAAVSASPLPRPAVVAERIAQCTPAQHPLQVYEQLLDVVRQSQEASV